tara:strand:- start:670 stop:1341 length:672 start_codon:yes stop_codon:yes gene_type:complete
MLFILFFMLLSAVKAEEPAYELTVADKKPEYQVIQIYVDLSEVHDPQGRVGTSIPLNVIIAERAQHTSLLEDRLHRYASPKTWEGEINVYDWNNIQYMPTFKKCNYQYAVKCGVQNSHWTLRTIVSVGQKYSMLTVYLYDERGIVIASSSQTTWGTIRWHPRWKLTTIKEQGPFGGGTKQIFERWPDRMEEVPPLITPKSIHQASFGFYWVNKSACRTKYCRK